MEEIISVSFPDLRAAEVLDHLRNEDEEVPMQANRYRSLFLFLFLPGLTAIAAEPQHIEREFDTFAQAMSVDSDVLTVGAPQASVDGSRWQGRAWIFERVGDTWQEVTMLIASDGQDEDMFGRAVAVDGDIAIVSAPNASVEGLPEAGVAYVFERDTSGQWQEGQKLVAADPTVMAGFGAEIELDGNFLLVSAPGADAELGEGNGAAYVFEHDGASWQQTVKLQREGFVDFASSIALSGQYLALRTAGHVFIYGHEGDGEWDFSQALPASGPAATVVMDGDVLAQVDPDGVVPDVTGVGVGRVLVFERVNGSWSHVASLESSQPMHLERFGHTADMRDGLLAVATGPEYDGQASLFMKNENGSWTRFAEVGGFPPIRRSVAVSAETLVTGGPFGGMGVASIFDVAELMSGVEDDSGDSDESGSGNNSGTEETDDTASEDEDAGSDDREGNNGSGDEDQTGDSDESDVGTGDTDLGGEDEGGDGNDGNDDSNDDDEGTGSEGGGDNGDDESGAETQPPVSDGGSGGGAAVWMLLVSLFARTRLLSVFRCLMQVIRNRRTVAPANPSHLWIASTEKNRE